MSVTMVVPSELLWLIARVVILPAAIWANLGLDHLEHGRQFL